MIRCLVVDDEQHAIDIMAHYIGQTNFLQLVSSTTNPVEALQTVITENIDLVFLDIHLPKLKGLDFIKALKKPPQIIITSAYQEYALQGYELNVVDYLLKPIEFNRFLMAVNKLKERSNGDALPVLPAAATERAALFFNVSKKRVKVYIDEILFIESLKEYIRITTKEKSILTKFQLGQIEEMLAKNGFLRVHRSFLVAKNKIDAFSATDVEVNGEQIPIGRSYKEVVMSILES